MPPANKVRLGDLLVRDGLISEADLRTMLAQQKQHGGRLGEHLVRVNLCTEEQIARALARQMGMPFNDLSDPPPPALTRLIPRDTAIKLQILAWGQDPFAKRLPVVFGDPTDVKTMMEAEKAVGRPIAPMVAPALLLRRAIESAYYSIDLRDEGTSEFQVTDVRGGARKIQVRPRAAAAPVEEEGAELPEAELEPLAEVVPEPQPAADGSGEEALRMVWALADLLIERGYIGRSDLMKKLRAK
jgi:hypothetical protein